MKYACLALFCLAFYCGLLPVTGLSAPPLRCDEVPHAMTFPQTPSTRIGVPSKGPHAPAAEPTRRQRIQSLIDRVNKLKPKLENPPTQPAADEEPPLLVEPQVVVPETSPPDKPLPLTSPSSATPPVLVEPDPAPSPQPVEQPELVPQPAPQPQLAPDPLLQPVPEPQPEQAPAPHTEPHPEPHPAVEQPTTPPDSPHPLPHVPAPAMPIPTPATADASPSHDDSPLTLPSELLDQAIDRQRMGNNLYAIGAYELALMNYEKMLQQPLSPLEAQWVRFQVANCQRHLGQLTQAQKAYRRVAGETSEEWLGQMSRWWLKELDDREQLQHRVAELDQIIRALEQEVDRAP